MKPGEYTATVTGYVSAPRERRTNRDSQYFFVNRRFVRDKTIAGGLLEGYRSVLPHGVYPVAFLFVDVPLEEIDVNVHPAKTEIRFRRSEAVKDAIAEGIRNALASAGIVAMPQDVKEVEQTRANSAAASIAHLPGPEIEQSRMQFAVESAILVAEDRNEPFVEEIAPAIEDQSSYFELSPENDLPPVLDNLFEEHDVEIKKEFKPSESFPEDQFAAVLPPLNSAERFVRPAEVADVAGSSIRPIAQLHDSFIIAVDNEGLLLVDQHVAHERILFDKYRALETGRAIESQNLLLPETLDLTPSQTAAFLLIEEQLSEVGFDAMKLSGRTVAIKSIPTDLPAAEAKNLLAELLDNIDVEKRGGAKTTLRDDIAASLACKAAVKINMRLTPEKMQWLIDRLLLTSSPTTCPHGRPVILRLTMKDIERGFHRT